MSGLLREVDVLVEEERLQLSAAELSGCVAALDRHGGWVVPGGDLVVRFVGEAECRRLHEAFYGDPEWTDVMTFPGEAEDGHAGDLAICAGFAAAEARARGEGFAEELSLYLVHGWLHLAGLRDGTEAERAEMRAAEAVLLDWLREEGALLRAEWKG